MNQRYLQVLIVVFVLLGGFYFLLQPRLERSAAREVKELFQDVDPSQVKELQIEQGEDKAILKLADGTWTVSDAGGYRAADGKVKQTVLKILGLEVSQFVTAAEKNFESLGVTEKAVTAGKSRVTFRNNEGKDLASIFLGESRKKEDPSGMSFPTGQYVRRADQNDVYLYGETITVNAQGVDWLEKDVVNVLSSRVEEIIQTTIGENQETLEFQLTQQRTPGAESKTPTFELSAPLQSGEKIDDTVLSQIRSGLENLRMENVYKQDAETVKGLTFSSLTTFKLNNGEIYTASAGEKEGKYYLRLAVRFDPELAKSLSERAKKEAEEKAAKDLAAQAAANSSGASSSAAAAPTPVVPAVELSSEDQAGKTNLRYAGWVYEVPEYIGKKFTYKRSQLVVKDTPATEKAAEKPASGKSAKKGKK